MFSDSRIGFIVLFSIVLLSFACAAQSEGRRNDNICEVTFSNLKGLPTDVLVGTDVVDISSFKISSQRLSRKYTAEMGGAILTLEFIQKGQIEAIKRTFQEPGKPGIVREYSAVCIVDQRLSANHLKGITVESGLLLIEEQPDIDGIPQSLWIYYRSK